MASQSINDGITESLRVGDRVWFRTGPYGDHRNLTRWGQIIAGPRPVRGSDYPAWLVRADLVPGADPANPLFTDGQWMGRLTRASDETSGA